MLGPNANLLVLREAWELPESSDQQLSEAVALALADVLPGSVTPALLEKATFGELLLTGCV